MVPFTSSICPDLSSCTGPTWLGLEVEGGGPKYDSPTVAPMEAGAGNRLQPGPGPNTPGLGCAKEIKGRANNSSPPRREKREDMSRNSPNSPGPFASRGN